MQVVVSSGDYSEFDEDIRHGQFDVAVFMIPPGIRTRKGPKIE